VESNYFVIRTKLLTYATKCKTYRDKKKLFGYVDIIHTCFIICVSTRTLKYHTLVKKVSKLILT